MTDKCATSAKRFEAINLSFNIGFPEAVGKLGNVAECNSGGSVICNAGTGGCGSGGLTCVGTSCSGSSATRELAFDSRILVEHEKLVALQKELIDLIHKYSR